MAKTTLDLVRISYDFIKEVLYNACDYVVYIKPGLFEEETEWITRSIGEYGAKITLIIEKGTRQFREGLAEPKSLEIIRDHLHEIDVRFVEKIELCVLLVDDFGLIFNPETGSDINTPGDLFNCVLLTDGLVDLLRYRICGVEAADGNQISNIIEPEELFRGEIVIDNLNNSVGSIKSVLEEYDGSPYNIEELLNVDWKYSIDDKIEAHSIIEDTIKELKDDPPLPIETIEEFKYYIDNYKLLKPKFTGINLSRKSINLNSFNEILKNSSSKLKSSWSILDKEDLTIQHNNRLFLECQKILYKKYEGYITDGGRHGKVIRKDITKEIEEELYKLLDEYKEFLLQGKDTKDNNRFIKVTNEVDDYGVISEQLVESKKELTGYLHSQIKDIRDIEDELEKIAYYVLWEYKHKSLSEEDAILKFIETFTKKVLKFPNLQDIISKIDLQLDIYGITEDLLKTNSDLVISLRNLEECKNAET